MPRPIRSPCPVSLLRTDTFQARTLQNYAGQQCISPRDHGLCQAREAAKRSLAPRRCSPRARGCSLPLSSTSACRPGNQNRPAAVDLAFCLAAFSSCRPEDHIERTLERDYLSRDPSSPLAPPTSAEPRPGPESGAARQGRVNRQHRVRRTRSKLLSRLGRHRKAA